MLRGVVLLLVSVGSLGCQSQSEDSAELASLQKQVAALTRQLEETRANVEMLEQQGREVSVTLRNVEAKIDKLRPLDSPAPSLMPGDTAANIAAQTTQQPPSPSVSLGADPSVAIEPPLALKTRVACNEVWALLGQGASLERIATVLGATLEAIEQCEQKIGRRSGEG